MSEAEVHERFDEPSARIFVRGEPRTGDTPRNPSLHLSKFSSSSFEFAICGFIPMLQQIKLHQPTHRCLENGTAALRIICCKAAMYTTPARRVNFQVRDQTREYRGAPQQTESKELVKDHFLERTVLEKERRSLGSKEQEEKAVGVASPPCGEKRATIGTGRAGHRH